MIKDSFDDDFEYSVECDGCGKQMKNPDADKDIAIRQDGSFFELNL